MAFGVMHTNLRLRFQIALTHVICPWR